MFSAMMSAFLIISLTISRPFGDFRFNVIDFLLTLNWWKYHGSSSGLPGRSRRPGSPRPGFSILTTSAPNQAKTSVEVVPASNWVKSTTLMPCKKLRSWVLSLILFPPVCPQIPAHSLLPPAANCNAFAPWPSIPIRRWGALRRPATDKADSHADTMRASEAKVPRLPPHQGRNILVDFEPLREWRDMNQNLTLKLVRWIIFTAVFSIVPVGVYILHSCMRQNLMDS